MQKNVQQQQLGNNAFNTNFFLNVGDNVVDDCAKIDYRHFGVIGRLFRYYASGQCCTSAAQVELAAI